MFFPKQKNQRHQAGDPKGRRDRESSGTRLTITGDDYGLRGRENKKGERATKSLCDKIMGRNWGQRIYIFGRRLRATITDDEEEELRIVDLKTKMKNDEDQDEDRDEDETEG